MFPVRSRHFRSGSVHLPRQPVLQTRLRQRTSTEKQKFLKWSTFEIEFLYYESPCLFFPGILQLNLMEALETGLCKREDVSSLSQPAYLNFNESLISIFLAYLC